MRVPMLSCSIYYQLKGAISSNSRDTKYHSFCTTVMTLKFLHNDEDNADDTKTIYSENIGVKNDGSLQRAEDSVGEEGSTG